MAEPLRHRQTKGAETDMLSLTSPRHTSTLRIPLKSRSLIAAECDLPIQPGQGADRIAGQPLCLVLADATQAVFAAWDEVFQTASSGFFSLTEPIDHSFVEIERFDSHIPGAALIENDDRARSGPR